MPLDPHIPTDSKEYLEGRRMTSLLSESLIWFMDLTHSLKIFSDSTDLLRCIVKVSSSSSWFWVLYWLISSLTWPSLSCSVCSSSVSFFDWFVPIIFWKYHKRNHKWIGSFMQCNNYAGIYILLIDQTENQSNHKWWIFYHCFLI